MSDTTTIVDFRNYVPSLGKPRRKERQQAAMSDHSHFEELAALEAGGFLSDEELIELREHTRVCVECRKAEEEFNELVRFGLPLTVSPVREFVDKAKTRPDNNMRPRFLRRARLEGIAFSPDVDEPARTNGRRIGLFTASAALTT